MNSAQHAISQLTWEEVRQAISLGYVNYNGLTDDAKIETDARMDLLLAHRDRLFAERRALRTR
jgi:hypothetical protein